MTKTWAGTAIGVVAVLTSMASTCGAGAQLVYQNDFETSAGPEWSKPTRRVTPAGARSFLGEFGSESVALTLNSLPPHGCLNVSFNLFVIRSWGGNAAMFGVDRWSFGVVGAPAALDTTFSTSPGDPVYGMQAYPDAFPAGAHPAHTGASEINTLGYTLTGPMDAVYALNFVLPHTASGVELAFTFHAPDQGLADESWGLDNVIVSAACPSAPAPVRATPWTALAVLGALLAATGAAAAYWRSRRDHKSGSPL